MKELNNGSSTREIEENTKKIQGESRNFSKAIVKMRQKRMEELAQQHEYLLREAGTLDHLSEQDKLSKNQAASEFLYSLQKTIADANTCHPLDRNAAGLATDRAGIILAAYPDIIGKFAADGKCPDIAHIAQKIQKKNKVPSRMNSTDSAKTLIGGADDKASFVMTSLEDLLKKSSTNYEMTYHETNFEILDTPDIDFDDEECIKIDSNTIPNFVETNVYPNRDEKKNLEEKNIRQAVKDGYKPGKGLIDYFIKSKTEKIIQEVEAKKKSDKSYQELNEATISSIELARSFYEQKLKTLRKLQFQNQTNREEYKIISRKIAFLENERNNGGVVQLAQMFNNNKTISHKEFVEAINSAKKEDKSLIELLPSLTSFTGIVNLQNSSH